MPIRIRGVGRVNLPRLRAAAGRWGGWVVLTGGAVLCVLGWYGVSGERFAERQIPYLASATVPGAALIIAGAVLVGRSESSLAAARVEELYDLLVAAEPVATAQGAAAGPVAVSAGPPRAVPDGTLFHRPDCPLAEGKPDAVPLGPDDLRERGLRPCPVCEPPVPGSKAE
jgi:hypothetical protein